MATNKPSTLIDAKLLALSLPKVPGITYWAARKQWTAKITVRDSRINLGTFDTYEEAVAVRRLAEQTMRLSPEEHAAWRASKGRLSQ